MGKIIVWALGMIFLASACATTPAVLPEKYNLDEALEPVRQISMLKVTNCSNIDNQSVILEADHTKYYLLVLRRPIDMEYSHVSIGIENTVSKDQARSTQEIMNDIRSSSGSAPNTEFVQGPSTIRSIIAGHDRVIVVEDTAERQYYVIEKMYNLKGREQAEEIKEWLRRN